MVVERGQALSTSGPVETPTDRRNYFHCNPIPQRLAPRHPHGCRPHKATFYEATELRWCRHDFDGLKTVAPEVIVSPFVR